MLAMRLHAPRQPLLLERQALPQLREHEVFLHMLACGVCRTDLHLLDGELANARYPITPGHEIVARVEVTGPAVKELRVGDRVGVPWLAWTCGVCEYCKSGQENLCARAEFTGCTRDGGYAESVIADARYCLRIPESYSHTEAAPLLCAGLIGYRSYRAAGDANMLGIYGFGAAAHLVAQVALAAGRSVFAFTRPGDESAQRFARALGCDWAGGSDQKAPVTLDAAIIFAPVGPLVPIALAAVRRGGRIVCAGIHMSDIPAFPYALLWGERSIASVANLTRADGREFMELAARVRLRPNVEVLPLAAANEALARLKSGALHGAAVLSPS